MLERFPALGKNGGTKNGGTHAVIGNIKIKQGASKDDVDKSLQSLEDKL